MAEINVEDNQDLEGSTDLGFTLGIESEDADEGNEVIMEGGMLSEDYEELGKEVLQDFVFDEQANDERFDKLKRIMSLVTQKADETYGEIEGSPSPYILPLLMTTAINFNSISYPAILNDGQPVKCSFYGDDKGVLKTKLTPNPNPFNGAPAIVQEQIMEGVGNKGKLADLYSQFNSWQLLKDIKHWEEEFDKLLMMISNIGCLFKKVYPDKIKKNVQSDLILPFQLVVHPSVKSLDNAPRISQVIQYYKHECETFIKSGKWFKDIELENFTPVSIDKLVDKKDDENEDRDSPLTFVEQHRRYDLDKDGYPEPVIVLVEKDSGVVCSVEPNYLQSESIKNTEGKIIYAEPIQYFIKYGFFRNPDGSIYDIGFGEIFFEQTTAINSAINMLLDSAHRSNMHTGLIGKGGVRMPGGTLTLKQGSYLFIESYGAALKDNIVQLEAKEPSLVLFQLLGFMTQFLKETTSQTDVMAGEAASNTTASGTLTLMESGIKQYKAIMKRIKNSLDRELDIMKGFNMIAFKKKNPFDIDFNDDIWKEDSLYVNASIDINNLTSSIRLAKTQILIEAGNSPAGQYLNSQRVAQEIVESLDVNKAQEFLRPNPPTTAQQQLQMGEQQNKQLELQTLMQKEKNRELELKIKAAEAHGRISLDHAKTTKTLSEIDQFKDDHDQAKIRLDNAETLKTIAEAHHIIEDAANPRETL